MTATPPAAVQPPARWWPPLFGVLALVLLPVLPPTHVLLPISPVTLLLVPALAACAIVGWQAGAGVMLAALLVALSTWMLTQPEFMSTAFGALSRGWSLILAGSFGFVCWAMPGRRFLPRALIAIGISLVLAGGAVLGGSPSAREEIRSTVATELGSRNDALFSAMRAELQSPDRLRAAGADSTSLKSLTTLLETGLRSVATGATAVFPALLAIESLAVLALTWAIFYRVSRGRLGPPLGRLRDFRFNDQVVWGLALGLTALILPTMATFRGIAWNLLTFLAGLYTLRGVGVVAWFLSPTRVVILAVVLEIGALVLPGVAALALGMLGVLGVGDTWADWRHRVRPSTLT